MQIEDLKLSEEEIIVLREDPEIERLSMKAVFKADQVDAAIAQHGQKLEEQVDRYFYNFASRLENNQIIPECINCDAVTLGDNTCFRYLSDAPPGNGICDNCGYPMRLDHNFVTPDGPEQLAYPLCFHPEEVSVPGDTMKSPNGDGNHDG